MEISTLGKKGYKLKGKQASVTIEDGRVVIDGEHPFKIDAPGEYEVAGVSVIGVQDPVGKIYIVELDGLRVCFAENLAGKLAEAQVEEIGPVDIALFAVSNPEVTAQLDPWVIVVEKGSEIVPIAKYAITFDRLPTETQTVVLERKA